MNEKAETILRDHGMRVTVPRLQVVEYFLQEEKTLRFKDLETRFREHDRVTLYRTLNSFTSKGIIHKIMDNRGDASYGLCHDTCEPGIHKHEHIHFKCDKCESIECLDHRIPQVHIPGYIIRQRNLIVNGICGDCNEA